MVQASEDSEGRELRIRVLYEAIKVGVGSLQKYELSRLVIKTKKLAEWWCVRLLVPKCCKIPKDKYLSTVRHCVVVNGLFVRCMVTEKDIICCETYR